jgi:hypothetical protein
MERLDRLPGFRPDPIFESDCADHLIVPNDVQDCCAAFGPVAVSLGEWRRDVQTALAEQGRPSNRDVGAIHRCLDSATGAGLEGGCWR